MVKKEFQTESKRILDLMINSVYTHREIFLRELISNASDAIDKLYFRSLTDPNIGLSRDDFRILITADKNNRTLTISDNGCGMNREELEKNLGTIARSGTLEFKTSNELKDDIDIIGQFGVGFYSAFMVSKKVTVISLAYGENQAYKWESTGVDGYTVEPCEKSEVGTDVILELKDNTDEENYDEFLNGYRISALVKKYSDYIRYPIKMEMERTRPKKNNDKEYETYYELETLNSMVPLWKRNKSDLKEEDYKEFYKNKFFDFSDPLLYVHTNAEGAVTYNALLYVPSNAPYNYYTKEFQRGLQLYSSGVLIMENCPELLPDYFSFVRGLVDTQDLSLNISREMLQHDRQLKLIAKSIEKKIKSELQKLLESDREKYTSFFKLFGLPIKFGIYQSFGANKDLLKDLLVYHSLNENKFITIQEYVDSMKPEQPHIYYVCGENVETVSRLPQLERIREKGFDVLCMTDDVDEFLVKLLGDWNGKKFVSVTSGDLGLSEEDEKKATDEKEKQYKELLDEVRKALEDKVSSVKLSMRLKSHPACLSSEGEVSLEMEKVLNAMPTGIDVKARRVLELNADHDVFKKLVELKDTDPDKLATYSRILYGQSLLIEGLPLEDPVAFSEDLCRIMSAG
ncbi:MAG: molecular chaperone HtpG [Clostridiales bacterium]|nr:molecular chaperone HtpG [Clostridiales bacterium]